MALIDWFDREKVVVRRVCFMYALIEDNRCGARGEEMTVNTWFDTRLNISRFIMANRAMHREFMYLDDKRLIPVTHPVFVVKIRKGCDDGAKSDSYYMIIQIAFKLHCTYVMVDFSHSTNLSKCSYR